MNHETHVVAKPVAAPSQPIHNTLLTRILVPGLLSTALLFSVTALAEPDQRKHRRGGPPSVETRLAHLAEQLSLSPEQSAQALTVLQQAEAAKQDIKDQASEAFGPDLCDLKNQTEQDMLSILDEAQSLQWEELKQQREQHKEKRGNRRGGEGNRPSCDEVI